ncbi:MAG: 5'-3' exonuclease [Acidimicrobiales bacterium]
MRVHVLDGTYELFRHHYARHAPGASRDASATEVDELAGTRGVVWSVLGLLEEGVTHLGVATDHVIESFRNGLWPTYKSSAGVPDTILDQFGLLEDALRALGVTVWPMVDFEADDALAAAASAAADDPTVEQVVVMTPDKDLAQCVRGTRVVQLDRRKGTITDEDGVKARYGILPESIPDWLALVGDSSDGFPGLKGWGKQAASTVLARYPHLEDIPEHAWRWEVDVRGRNGLGAVLGANRELASLFRDLATLRRGPEVLGAPLEPEALRWPGPTPGLAEMADLLRAPRLAEKAAAIAR